MADRIHARAGLHNRRVIAKIANQWHSACCNQVLHLPIITPHHDRLVAAREQGRDDILAHETSTASYKHTHEMPSLLRTLHDYSVVHSAWCVVHSAWCRNTQYARRSTWV